MWRIFSQHRNASQVTDDWAVRPGAGSLLCAMVHPLRAHSFTGVTEGQATAACGSVADLGAQR